MLKSKSFVFKEMFIKNNIADIWENLTFLFWRNGENNILKNQAIIK